MPAAVRPVGRGSAGITRINQLGVCVPQISACVADREFISSPVVDGRRRACLAVHGCRGQMSLLEFVFTTGVPLAIGWELVQSQRFSES